MPDQQESSSRRESLADQFRDASLLLCAALTVCVVGGGAFLISEVYHISPLWAFFGLGSVGFVAGIYEEYRKQFRSFRFVLFVFAWVLVNIAVIVIVVVCLGLVYLIPALLLEQFLFYMSVYWFFGIQPPLRRSTRIAPSDRQ